MAADRGHLQAISQGRGRWERFDWEVVPAVDEPGHRVVPVESNNAVRSQLGVHQYIVSPNYPVTRGINAPQERFALARGQGNTPLYIIRFEQSLRSLTQAELNAVAQGQGPFPDSIIRHLIDRPFIVPIHPSASGSLEVQGAVLGGLIEALLVQGDVTQVVGRADGPLPPFGENAPPGCDVHWSPADEEVLSEHRWTIAMSGLICAFSASGVGQGFLGQTPALGMAFAALVENGMSWNNNGAGCGSFPTFPCPGAEMEYRRSCCSDPNQENPYYTIEDFNEAGAPEECGFPRIDPASCACPSGTRWLPETLQCDSCDQFKVELTPRSRIEQQWYEAASADDMNARIPREISGRGFEVRVVCGNSTPTNESCSHGDRIRFGGHTWVVDSDPDWSTWRPAGAITGLEYWDYDVVNFRPTRNGLTVLFREGDCY